jgi:hypothetical protein
VASASETYLAALANETFLKPWAIANPFRKRGKEISDLIVPFGQDVVMVSDKACRFNSKIDVALAWSRWERDAIDESVKQLAGAVRQLDRPDCRIFVDHKATEPLAFDVPPPAARRYHLIAVGRPDKDPGHVPRGWPGLVYADEAPPKPFQVGPRFIGDHFVHVFDGETLDLLVRHLSTGPDLIAYLSSRAAALSRRPGVTFGEADLLAVATFNWMNGAGFSVTLNADEKAQLKESPWAAYTISERAQHTRKEAEDSKKGVDLVISEFHREYTERRARSADAPDPQRHEEAMRLLAAENRFARRMIFGSLKSILLEEDQSTFWMSTVPSPTQPGVRYLWLAYPKKPVDVSDDEFAAGVSAHLGQYLIVLADEFPEDTLVGIAVPNRKAHDNLLAMRVLDASNRGPEAAAQAAFWRERGVLDTLDPDPHLHVP